MPEINLINLQSLLFGQTNCANNADLGRGLLSYSNFLEIAETFGASKSLQFLWLQTHFYLLLIFLHERLQTHFYLLLIFLHELKLPFFNLDFQ